jgi:hypothetical protein
VKRGITVLGGIMLVLIGIAMLFADGGIFDGDEQAIERSWSFAPGELRQLKIESTLGVKLSFVKSTDGTDSVSLYGKGGEKLASAIGQIALKNGTLDLDLREHKNLIKTIFNSFDDRPGNVIVVALNEDTLLEQVKLKSVAGRLEARDVSARTVDIELDSGDLILTNLKADRFHSQISSGNFTADGLHADSDIHSSSGSIKLLGLAGKATIRSSSGNIRIEKDDTSDLEVKSSSGNVHIRMPAAFAGYYDLQTSSGTIDAPASKRLTEDLVKVRASSGNITIEQR